MTKALVIGPGGLRGAYGGGVVATLGRELGHDYFDTIYGCSAGSYTASYLASGQPEMIETIWRECVHGNLLIRWGNLLRPGLPVLDLFYLNNVLRSREYYLSVEKMLDSKVRMLMVATDCKTGKPEYFSPTTSEEFFLQVRASAAMPYVHPKVLINGMEYVDGCMSDPFPIEKAIADGHEEIVVVCNRQDRGDVLASQKYTVPVRVIYPSVKNVLRSKLDSSEHRINQLVDLGINDTLTHIA